MNTDDKKVSDEAWDNIGMCCQTLCEKEKVIRYIKDLESENELLRAMLKYAGGRLD